MKSHLDGEKDEFVVMYLPVKNAFERDPRESLFGKKIAALDQSYRHHLQR